MVSSIEQVLLFWVDLGLYDVILPFLFVFIIVYSILERTKILGEYRNIDVIVAFVFGFTGTVSLQFVEGLQMFWSTIGLFSVAGVLLFILLGMFGVKSLRGPGNKWFDKLPKALVIIFIAGVFAFIALKYFGLENIVYIALPFMKSLLSQALLAFVVFVLIIWFIVKESKHGSNSSSSSSGSSKPSNSESASSAPKNEERETLFSRKKSDGGFNTSDNKKK